MKLLGYEYACLGYKVPRSSRHVKASGCFPLLDLVVLQWHGSDLALGLIERIDHVDVSGAKYDLD